MFQGDLYRSTKMVHFTCNPLQYPHFFPSSPSSLQALIYNHHDFHMPLGLYALFLCHHLRLQTGSCPLWRRNMRIHGPKLFQLLHHLAIRRACRLWFLCDVCDNSQPVIVCPSPDVVQEDKNNHVRKRHGSYSEAYPAFRAGLLSVCLS